MSENRIAEKFRAVPRLGATLLGLAAIAAPALAEVHQGEAVKLGNGTAQVLVDTDATGLPTSISISMTAEALDGLPAELNKASAEGSWDFPLPMPAGVETGYKEVVVDWNPHGHPPPDVYTVPHFDFHFYTLMPDDIAAITFSGPDDPAAQVFDKDLIPPDYQVIPDTAINMMGVHAIDMTAPELHGTPFTATFIYGYDKGKLIFVEPMVTLAYLKTDPDATLPVKTPARYSSPGYYPTNYSVQYDAGNKRYLIDLGGLKAWQ
ncbi:MAG: hypothetical protein WCD16_10255 [Paracoccaceae bacterium]